MTAMARYDYYSDRKILNIDYKYLAEGLAVAKRRRLRSVAIRRLAAPTPRIHRVDLEPIRNQTWIRVLELDSLVSGREKVVLENIDALYSLRHLRSLDLAAMPVDLGQFSELTTLNIELRAQHMPDLGSSPIETVTVMNGPENTLGPLTRVKTLRSLQILGSTLSSLDGFEKLKTLRFLRLTGSPRVTDAYPISRCRQLQELNVEACPRLLDWSSLRAHPALQTLFLAELQSLSFVPSLPKLERFSFWDCKDNDLSPLFRCKHFKQAWFHPSRKRYSHTRAEFDEYLERLESRRKRAASK